MKLVIGFITYGDSTAKYLPYFLPSLHEANKGEGMIMAVDNTETEDNANSRYVKAGYPDMDIVWAGKNIGFARAYNIMIEKAIKAGAEYFLAVNPDMIFEPDFIKEMIKTIEFDDRLAAVAPKILKWDFANQRKSNIIDSQGIFITKEHRFSDVGQGADESAMPSKSIFGFTGAAVLMRINALDDVSYSIEGKKEFFDELMFMYKEDADLSYRFRLAGWKIKFAPRAVCYHDRSASPMGESNLRIALNRKNKSRRVKRWSFCNHWVLFLKYMNIPYSMTVRVKTAWYMLKMSVYALFFEAYLMKEIFGIWQNRRIINIKRKKTKITIDPADIERLME